jgi:hypothetical protein
MDDDLRQQFAPRRNKRYAHLRGFSEDARWADTVDWQTNEYDFYRLRRSILDHLDSEYREKGGIRIDQLATAEEIESMFRTCRTWYQEEKQLFGRSGIYRFLHLTIGLWLGGKACDAIDGRRKKAEQAAA